MAIKPIKIGTRASALALVQAQEVKARLQTALGAGDMRFEIVAMRTKGDEITDRPLTALGGKGLFTKEIEESLQSGDLDIAVHSMKDMPTQCADGLSIGCILPREDVRDAFISPRYKFIADLPKGARFGTSSIRRRAQLLTMRPDLNIVEFRGNVQTRLQKLADGVAEATLLAAAGLHRLSEQGVISSYLETDYMLPAPAQGAIGVQLRADNDAMLEMLSLINDTATQRCVSAERAFLARLDGSCATPIAAFAHECGKDLHLHGQLLDPKTGRNIRLDLKGADPQSLGQRLGERVLSRFLKY